MYLKTARLSIRLILPISIGHNGGIDKTAVISCFFSGEPRLGDLALKSSSCGRNVSKFCQFTKKTYIRPGFDCSANKPVVGYCSFPPMTSWSHVQEIKLQEKSFLGFLNFYAFPLRCWALSCLDR
jgi:hypothetical protein